VLLDLFWFGWRTHRRVGAHVSFDPSFDHYFKTAPLVAITAHLGNWEVMGLAAARHGEPAFSVAAPLDNRFVDRMLTRLREETGQQIAEQGGAVRTLLKALKHGGRTALLLDQNTLPRDGGVFVTLFGRPVPISKTAAGLASHSGAPIVFTYCVADEKGHYRAYALPPMKASGKRGDEIEITQAIAGMLESVITKHPDQWLWMYKRWKYIPDGESPEQYPFYARRLRTEQKMGEQE
jgi:lauroyl/myristoyl acyltransferase